MDDLAERAARWGIETEYWDGLRRQRRVEPPVLERLIDIVAPSAEGMPRMLPELVVVRRGYNRRLHLEGVPDCRVRWEVMVDGTMVAGEGDGPSFALPDDLPIGAWRLHVDATSPQGQRREEATLLVAPGRAYQGASPGRSWALAVQLYAVRSRHNWGHGDFTDLAGLIDLAAELGAAGVGLNPLHALFDDRAHEASPYYPNSRLFLNPLYIDVESIPEYPGLSADGLGEDVVALRQGEMVDYPAVAKAKVRALALAYAAFCAGASAQRRRDFARFREERGKPLAHFAAFELLRRRYGGPWWTWPEPWRRPDDDDLRHLQEADGEAIGHYEFLQWIADEQLGACRDRADRLGLSIGLYLDIAVGVRPDGFDAWSDQDLIVRALEVGAPPDLLNTDGQRWGLAGVNPRLLVTRRCEPFRQLLRASMRYAGAVRLDHVMGLRRLFLFPGGLRSGGYVRFPFEALLAVTAQESVANECIVIGEDLGTVPENFRETMADWGIWSYQVMMFERADDGGFVAPDHYRENVLVTFATHDLPTFAGWTSHRDLAVKRALGLDPGETDDERAAAKAALGRTLAWRGLPSVDHASVTRFLASTPSRFLVVSIDDALGVVEQINLPGTIEEHPNWRRRLPVSLEDVGRQAGVASLAQIMASAGRSAAGVDP